MTTSPEDASQLPNERPITGYPGDNQIRPIQSANQPSPSLQPPFVPHPPPVLPDTFAPRGRSLSLSLFWVLAVVGLVLAIGGGVLMFASPTRTTAPQSSHPATYQRTSGTIVFISTTSGTGFGSIDTGYIVLENSKSIYYWKGTDVSLTFDSLTGFIGKNTIIIYRSDNPITINENTGRGYLQGMGYQLAQITVSDNNAQNPQVFTSTSYAQYLQTQSGGSSNAVKTNQGLGLALLIVGLILAIGGLIVSLVLRAFTRRQQVALNIAPGAPIRTPIVEEIPPAGSAAQSFEHPQEPLP